MCPRSCQFWRPRRHRQRRWCYCKARRQPEDCPRCAFASQLHLLFLAFCDLFDCSCEPDGALCAHVQLVDASWKLRSVDLTVQMSLRLRQNGLVCFLVSHRRSGQGMRIYPIARSAASSLRLSRGNITAVSVRSLCATRAPNSVFRCSSRKKSPRNELMTAASIFCVTGAGEYLHAQAGDNFPVTTFHCCRGER